MIIFFSGGGANKGRPEHVIADQSPAIMLTYWEIFNKGTAFPRFKKHKLQRERAKNASKSRRTR